MGNGNTVNTFLVVIDPHTQEIEFMNYPGDFTSADKVRGFLAVRKMKMS